MGDNASKQLVGDSTGGGSGRGAKGKVAFDDDVLVERCKKGDMEAFGLLVAKHQDRIFNTIYRICGHRADAEELAQDVFLKVLERIGQFRGGSHFYTWLYRIAVNTTISHRRRAGRVKFGSLSGPPGFENSQAGALTAKLAERRQSGPAAAAVAAETHRRVIDALETLDDEFRLVVVLRDVEEMNYAQISRVLDVPVGTVKSRLHRGRTLLREKLADLVEQK